MMQPEKTPLREVRISSSKILIAMLGCVALLVLAHTVSHRAFHVAPSKYTEQLIEWFDLDSEGNYPTFFSSLLLLVASAQFYLIGRLHSAEADEDRRKHASQSRYWIWLSAIFAFLSLDEAVQIHEMFDSQSLLSFMNTTGLLAWPWVLVYLGLVVAFVGVFFKFWLRLEEPWRSSYAVCAVMYVFGAIGFEMFGAKVFTEGGNNSNLYFLLYTFEEAIEMTAISLLIFANNGLLGNLPQRAVLRFRPVPARNPASAVDESHSVSTT